MSGAGAPAAARPGLASRARAVLSRPRRGASPVLWLVALYVLIFLGLLLANAICSRVSMSISVTRDARGVTIHAGSVTRHLTTQARLLAVSLPPRDPTLHDYQLDGTDAANNYTLDTAYLRAIASSPYYRFFAWMRGLDDLSRWRDLCVAADSAPARCDAAPPIARGVSLPIPDGVSQRVTVALQQPEAPVALDLALSDGSGVTLTIDPNDHFIAIAPFDYTSAPLPTTSAFYPANSDLWPLAAQTLDLVIRVLLWSLALLGAVWGIEAAVGWLALRTRWSDLTPQPPLRRGEEEAVSQPAQAGFVAARPLGAGSPAGPTVGPTAAPAPAATCIAARAGVTLRAAWARLSGAIHPIGLALIAASFIFTIWIALAQYHAQPHIYDASAYIFQARIYASGRLYAPAPAAPGQFPGPFMALVGNRWFSQYEPGTSATLALGVVAGVPWLVEPLLGALALLGMGLTLGRLYDRRVATLAVALGAISPFYLWLAASYLSHTIALFYLIWGFWSLTVFAQGRARGGRWLHLPLAVALWGLALLTRDTSALFIAAAVGGLAWVAWRERWPITRRETWAAPLSWILPAAWTAIAIALYLTIYLDYNNILTGKPLLTPRALIFAADHWGFGPGVGFYGQHTLAAGFITVQALLTSLSITLFGWPFYLTLAFLPLPFLARRARPADLALLAGALLMTFAFLGFYYHGIYLGPRYLFEALPFFLGLTARGIITLFEVGARARPAFAPRPAGQATSAAPVWAQGSHMRKGDKGVRPPPFAASALLLALLTCAMLYYFPRQIALHTNFTGMGAGATLQTAKLSHPPIHHAIVITGDSQLYGYTLFGLNDPLLRGDVLYAYAPAATDYAALRRAYPGRALYLLSFDSHGQPRYLPLRG